MKILITGSAGGIGRAIAEKFLVEGHEVIGFDREEAAKALVMALGKSKGIDMSEAEAVDFQAFKETQYDLLAAALREHLDMEKIYRILEEGADVK